MKATPKTKACTPGPGPDYALLLGLSHRQSGLLSVVIEQEIETRFAQRRRHLFRKGSENRAYDYLLMRDLIDIERRLNPMRKQRQRNWKREGTK